MSFTCFFSLFLSLFLACSIVFVDSKSATKQNHTVFVYWVFDVAAAPISGGYVRFFSLQFQNQITLSDRKWASTKREHELSQCIVLRCFVFHFVIIVIINLLLNQVELIICNGKYIGRPHYMKKREKSTQWDLTRHTIHMQHATATSNNNGRDNQSFQCKQPLAEYMSQEIKWISWLSIDKLNVQFLCLAVVWPQFQGNKKACLHSRPQNEIRPLKREQTLTHPLDFPQIFMLDWSTIWKTTNPSMMTKRFSLYCYRKCYRYR